MLKGLPAILSPELLKILCEMGHGDELVIGDGNFPAASCAQRLVRLDGHGVCEILDAILRVFPLDTYVAAPVALMQVSPGDDYKPEIWPEYRRIVLEREGDHRFEEIERFAFYERAKKAIVRSAISFCKRQASSSAFRAICTKKRARQTPARP